MRGSFCLAVVFLCLLPRPARAIDPDKRISQYAHFAWRVQDGFFKGSPRRIVQTQDGYVWLGTTSELLRFDGVRFVPWNSEHGERLTGNRIEDLLAAQDGSLWISTGAGLNRWKDQALSKYQAPGGRFLVEDRNGTIWFGQGMSGTGSLCQVVESATRCHALADAARAGGAPGRLIEDRQGNIWIGTSRGLVRWTNGSQTVYQPAGLNTNFAAGVIALAETPDGTIWAGIAQRGEGLGLQQLVQGRWQTVNTPELDGATLSVTDLHLDREGALWIGTADQGIYRLYRNHVDHFDSTGGLSSNFVLAFGSDREGNLWVATDQGVDRFSDTAVVAFSTNEGLCSAKVDSILAAQDGSLWIGGYRALSTLRDGRVTCLRTGAGLPGAQVTSLLEDHAGRLWVGLDNMLWVNERGRFRRVTKRDGSQVGFVTGIAEDAEHNVWVVANGPPRTLLRIQGLEVREEYSGARMARRVAIDPTGGVWLGMMTGDLAHYRNGELTEHKFAPDSSAVLHQLLPDPDGSVLAATSYGLIGWQNGKQRVLSEKNGLPCAEIDAMTFDDQGDLWLFMNCALGELTSADLQMWKRDPDHRVLLRTFDMLDGVRTGEAPFLAAARSPDGRLWFSNGATLQMADPDHARRNTLLPPVHIESIVADGRRYSATGIVRLPARSRDIEIHYTALSFSAPQKVRFRYLLEGRDQDWHDAGTRRQAFYSDLPPAQYRFRVIASNNDGVWNDTGAVLDLAVLPAYYQTTMFRTVSVAATLALLWAVYRFRLRQVAHAFDARLQERVNERTRIARELHDTLLQSLHGVMFRFQAARNMLPGRTDEAMHTLDGAILRTEQAIAESREAIQDLRSESARQRDLGDALATFVKELRGQETNQDSPRFHVTIEGEPQELLPMLHDEVFRIARELIRNAFRHARAHQIEAEIRYDHAAFCLRIRDDGTGIDPKTKHDAERTGHWGLRGIRERAQRIGAQLDVWSEAAAGTEVQLRVPAAIAYEPSRAKSRLRPH